MPVLVNPSRFARSTAYSDAVLADTPSLYWKLDEASGNALDYSGNSRVGTYSNSPTREQPSLLASDGGKSVHVAAASTQSIFRSSETWMNFTTALTVEGWFKIDGSAGSGGTHTLIAKDSLDAAFSSRAWRLTWDSVGDTLGWSGFVTSTTRFTAIAPTGSIANGGPRRHIVGTYDGSVGRLYVDGAEVATSSLTGSLRTSTYALQVGKDSTTGSKYAMTGFADEVAVYGSVLSAARVLAHYNAGAS